MDHIIALPSPRWRTQPYPLPLSLSPSLPRLVQDVVIASGCSGALDLAISAVLNAGDVLLLPKPAFPLYQTLADSKGVACQHYKLLPEQQWEIDLVHLESLMKAAKCGPEGPRNTVLLVNNPSNPCGSVYGREHLLDILALADRYKVLIIADEIYGGLVFPSSGASFHAMASLTDSVPILTCGGIAKEFLVPGWRVGWVVVHDRQGLLAHVRKGLLALTQLILGSCSLVVSALPAILDPVPGTAEAASLDAFRQNTISQLENSASYVAARIRCMPGLSVCIPQGAMYVMFGMDPSFFATSAGAQPEGAGSEGQGAVSIEDDVELAQALLAEENVFVLPGQCFTMPGYCRIVYCAPKMHLAQAMDRLEAFLLRHAAQPTEAQQELERRKAAAAEELSRLSSPWAPPAPHVGLSWGVVPSPGGAHPLALQALTPRLSFLSDMPVTALSLSLAGSAAVMNGTPGAISNLHGPSSAAVYSGTTGSAAPVLATINGKAGGILQAGIAVLAEEAKH